VVGKVVCISVAEFTVSRKIEAVTKKWATTVGLVERSEIEAELGENRRESRQNWGGGNCGEYRQKLGEVAGD
jgi:hypothetical protein